MDVRVEQAVYMLAQQLNVAFQQAHRTQLLRVVYAPKIKVLNIESSKFILFCKRRETNVKYFIGVMAFKKKMKLVHRRWMRWGYGQARVMDG